MVHSEYNCPKRLTKIGFKPRWGGEVLLLLLVLPLNQKTRLFIAPTFRFTILEHSHFVITIPILAKKLFTQAAHKDKNTD